MIASDMAKLVRAVTKRYSKQRKTEKRHARARSNRLARLSRAKQLTQVDAANAVIPEAYAKASSNGRYPAKARQIFYAARKRVLELIGQDSIDSKYFTQTLLPSFVAANEQLTKHWRIAYDPRGHLSEPHTGYSIGIGTLEVESYLTRIRVHRPPEIKAELSLPYPTIGMTNRCSGSLFIEKEGFDELFTQEKLAERYDLTIMSTKGDSVVAARRLVDHLCNTQTDVPVLLFHDFDKKGVEIGRLLTEVSSEAEEGGRVRYRFENQVKFIDCGLWLADVEEWGLESEPCPFKGDFPVGSWASEDDRDFLRSGQRVELNAFTSEDFIRWIESKLEEHGIRKVIPDDETLDEAYRRALQITTVNRKIKGLIKKAARDATVAKIPPTLRDDIEAELKSHPEIPWDEAIARIIDPKRGK